MTTDQAAALIAETEAEVRRCCADLEHVETCRLFEQLRVEPSRAEQCRVIAAIMRVCQAVAHDADVAHELGLFGETMDDYAESADLAEDEAKREEHFAKQRELRRRRGEIV